MTVVQTEYHNTHAVWAWGERKFWNNDRIRVTLKTSKIHEGGFVAGPTTNFRGIQIMVGEGGVVRVFESDIETAEKPKSPGEHERATRR